LALDPIAEFREDHRKVRDGLLALEAAIRENRIGEARETLGQLNQLVGPHFRYEEEALYPTLREYLGEYVDQLLTEHDGVIRTARACAELLQKDELSPEERSQGARAARALLVHVSNCDGLAIISERLSPEKVSELSARLEECRRQGVPLLEWAATIRERRVA
jgi:hypothetical protein